MDNKENNSPLSGERVENPITYFSTENGEHGYCHDAKQNNVPQVKSVEEIQNAIIENQLDITGWNVSPDSTMRSMIKACMNEYSKSRIAELEAENAKLREAYEVTVKFCQQWCQEPEEIDMLNQLKQALKGKEAKGE